jgi:hypothetical protein
MATYTPDELSAIANAPMSIGMAVAMADMGIFSSAIEAVALTKEIVGAANIKRQKPDVTAEDVKSGAIITKAIASVDVAVSAIGTKATPAEVAEFKQFIYACAETVASAAGSGLFGSGDPKVSTEEATALAKIKVALSL